VEALFLFSFECAAQLFGVMFSHPLLGLFQVTSFWFASFLFGGFLVPEANVPMPLRLLVPLSPINWASKAIVRAEFACNEFEGANLDPSSPRGFSCSTIECYGRTGEQVLETLRQTAAKNLGAEPQLLLDCAMLLVIAILFRLCYFLVVCLRCRSGQPVQAPDF